jgi:hypothetical protein
MSVRWQSFSEVRLLLAATLAVLFVARPAAHAQSVHGSLAVSATILPPVPQPETRLSAFSIGRDGVVQLETTSSIAAPVSRIVMWSVASSTNGFVPVMQPPMRIQARRREPDAPTSSRDFQQMRLRFGMSLGDIGLSPTDTTTRDVTVRIHYLIVPAT